MKMLDVVEDMPDLPYAEWARRLLDALGRRESLRIEKPNGVGETDGASIFGSGDCLVSRVAGVPVLLVSAKRYRLRWGNGPLRAALLAELEARSVAFARVKPLYLARRVQPDDLAEWWFARATVCGNGDNAGAAAARLSREYEWDAAVLVEAWWIGIAARIGPRTRHSTTFQGSIYAVVECLVTRSPDGKGAILSRKRYWSGTHSRMLRDALKVALERAHIPVLEVRPKYTGYTHPEDLIRAWRPRCSLLSVARPQGPMSPSGERNSGKGARVLPRRSS
jgi:hypothetical protein